MKKIAGILLLIFIPLLTYTAQELQHEAVAVNIEVPVRVYKGAQFHCDLALKDFEIYEDGVLQKFEALYLIKKANIAREETGLNTKSALGKYTPEVSRSFVLIFEMNEYLPKMGEVVDHFFFEVIRPGETLQVFTPVKAYNFNNKAFEVLSKEQLSQQLKHFKTFHEQKFVDYAALLKTEAGQKHLFMLYQQELLPIPSMITVNSTDYFDLMSEIGVDFDKIKRAFSDSSISSHFISKSSRCFRAVLYSLLQTERLPRGCEIPQHKG